MAAPIHWNSRGANIAMISLHGLVRGSAIELGRDSDTGGQVQYVIELARALAQRSDVARVSLFTRQIDDPRLHEDYNTPEEWLDDLGKARIIRLRCGPKRYVRKESLWPYVDEFADRMLQHFRADRSLPDIVHGHYADAGLVAARVSSCIDRPFIHTGHSLGRCKKERLLRKGLSEEGIEKRFNMKTRIEAEEIALANAHLIIASTKQELEQQYSLYDDWSPSRGRVIPPGVNLERFGTKASEASVMKAQQLARPFLRDIDKPLILAIARADPRKNLSALVHAYGQSEGLRKQANLLIVAGTRENLESLGRESRRVLTELLRLQDDYNLYGCLALPKDHQAEDIPGFYAWCAQSRGVFANPALTEPFGLTLLEAAASGVPVVATDDGGPKEILSRCRNGLLVNPLDIEAIGDALAKILGDSQGWADKAQAGMNGVKRYYSWDAHAESYLEEVEKLQAIEATKPREGSFGNRLATVEHVFVSDIDNTLIGNDGATAKIVTKLKAERSTLGFAVATGRHLESALEVLSLHEVPVPDVLITSVGTEIHYGPRLEPDRTWTRHLDWRWDREKVQRCLGEVAGLSLQDSPKQRRFKISYDVDVEKAPSLTKIRSLMRQNGIKAHCVWSHEKYLDVLPVRASKGRAIRHLAMKWGVPLESIICAGDSGNDMDMLRGLTRSVVVGNHSQELKRLEGLEGVYFASGEFGIGVLEGLDHWLKHESKREDEFSMMEAH